MSSGSLPLSKYHRAAHLGTGTYGSVVTVYNDDGEEYALKLFLPDDDDDDDDEYDNSDDEEETPSKPIELGALREISCLRLLRGHHENIIRLEDVQADWGEDGDDQGAGTSGCLGMAIPLYPAGSLADAIGRQTFQAYPKRVKVQLAHGILSAVAFLHDNHIMHRDIKSDNILLEHDPDTDQWKPILIDFSLAKPVIPGYNNDDEEEECQHTGEVGTVTYTAPEIVNQEPYGLPSDLYSVGVVLLELLQNEMLTAQKERQAATEIQQALDKLPTDAPFPNLLRSLLEEDPAERCTARQALEHTLFAKFNLQVPPVKHIDVATALPYADTDEENDAPVIVAAANNSNNKSNSKTPKKKNVDKRLENRMKFIHKVLENDLNSNSPFTHQAALEYCQQFSELDDEIDDINKSQGLLDCIVLAHRFFDLEMADLDELDECDSGRFANWSLEDYVDNESTIFMMLDYCLYPRNLKMTSDPHFNPYL